MMAPLNRSQPPWTEPCGKGYAQLLRLPDEEIMQHLALGHDDALAVLYDRYHRLVFSVAVRILRDTGEAQDVTQEAFLKLYRTVAQFDAAKGMTRMWILRFAYQLSLNRRRYLKLRCFYGPDAEAWANDVATPTADPRMHPVEAARLVSQLLGQLGDRQRRAIELACFEGLSMDEVAAKTGESVGNVRHHYYRGIAKLRALLAERRSVSAAGEREVTDGSARQLA
jgi:RNA polymerase sigma-70 factor (ECF subfamily)